MLSSRPGTVLVTGGSSGLGAAVVTAVRKAGGEALVIDVAPPGVDVEHVVADVSDTPAVAAAVEQLAGRVGGLDGVVTAAGIDRCGALVDVPPTEWERVVRVNLFGTAAVARAALPHLEARHGRLVTVASTLGVNVAGDATAYCASKFGVVGFTRALAKEMSGRVGVTLLIPGGMQTAFFDDRDPQYKPTDRSTLSRPDDVADLILHALLAPENIELRELVACHPLETSWP